MTEKTTIYQKLLKVQQEVGAIKKSKKNPFFNSNYFDINVLLEVIKPILSKHGLLLLQPLEQVAGALYLITILIDTESGEELKYPVALPEMSKPQDMGSAITYYRRYAIQSLLALEAEDDDGNTASKSYKKPVNSRIRYPQWSATAATAVSNVKSQLQFKHKLGCKGTIAKDTLPDGEVIWQCSSCGDGIKEA